MSQSRLERVGSVYSRMKALLDSGARRPEFRPIWMDVYEAFPPRLEPRWDRKPAREDEGLDKILYREDRARAQFFRQFGDRTQAYDLLRKQQDGPAAHLAQRFVDKFEKVAEEGVTFEDNFARAVEAMEVEDGVKLSSLDPEAGRPSWGPRDSRELRRREFKARGEAAAVKEDEGGRVEEDGRPRAKLEQISFKELFSQTQSENKEDK